MTEPDEHALAANAPETTSVDGPSNEKNPANNEASGKLRALTAEYEARMDEVADLITRVRHEINNPLTGVLGQAQLLLREDLPERAKKRAETIEALAMRIRDIVAQLRQVQKTSRS
jgi:signal transduction histidine kinase